MAADQFSSMYSLFLYPIEIIGCEFDRFQGSAVRENTDEPPKYDGGSRGIIARYSTVITVPHAPYAIDLMAIDRVLRGLPKPCPHTSWKKTWPFLDLKKPWLSAKLYAFEQRLASHFCAREIKKYGKVSLHTFNVARGYDQRFPVEPLLDGTKLNSTEMCCLLLHAQPCICLEQSTAGFGQVARCEACNIGYTFGIVDDNYGRHAIKFTIADGQRWKSVLQNASVL